jgi:endoribonuclease LACTB2
VGAGRLCFSKAKSPLAQDQTTRDRNAGRGLRRAPQRPNRVVAVRNASSRFVIRVERHGDVVRFDMSSRRSRLLGYSVSAYVLRHVLVDCGFPAVGGEVSGLIDHDRLAGLVLTHHHEDHAGNVALLASRGLPVAASPMALRAVRKPAPLLPYRRFAWGTPRPLEGAITPFEPEGMELLPTPGHSDDHVAVWDRDSHTVFAGDLFLGVKVRVAHATENPRRLVESLRRIAALEPDRLFDGHRGLVPDPVARLLAKADWMEEMIAQVERLADDGLSEAAIARTVFGHRTVTDVVSQGEYSRRNLVRAVRRTRNGAGR